MTRSKLVLAAGILAVAAGAQAQTTTVYDNGVAHGLGSIGLVTHPGAGPGGFDISQRPATTTPDFISGSGIQGGINGVADRFTVPAGQSFTINAVTLFVYVRGAYTIPPTSPITDLNLSILSDAPSQSSFPYAPTPDVLAQGIYNQSSANMTSTFSGIWRTPFGDTTSTSRAIFAVTARIPEITLTEGDYWMSFSAKGTAPSGTPGVNSHDIFAPVLTGVSAGNPYYPVGIAQQLVSNWNTIATGNPSQGINFPFQLLQVTVPEPSPAVLLLPGLGGLLLTLRRRRR